MTHVDLLERAKRRQAALAKARRDPRYRRALGRFVAAGLLTTTESIEPHHEAIDVEEALWAGRTEPRILELLPAAIVKRPGLFRNVRDLPEDLAQVVRDLRKNRQPPTFRGIPGEALHRWLTVVGRRNKVPSQLKAFRLQERDIRLLETLSAGLDVSQTEVLRRALRCLAAKQMPSS
jgi:hypothetical protein